MRKVFLIFIFSLMFTCLNLSAQNIVKDTNSWIKTWFALDYMDTSITCLSGTIMAEGVLSGKDTLIPLKNAKVEFINRKTHKISRVKSGNDGDYGICANDVNYFKGLPDSLAYGWATFDVIISLRGYCSIILIDYEPNGDATTQLDVVLVRGNKKRIYSVPETLKDIYSDK